MRSQPQGKERRRKYFGGYMVTGGITNLWYDRPSLMENVKLAGRGIRRLVTLFTPLTRLVAEYDRRHQLMIENLLALSEEVDWEDPCAVAAKAE